MSPRARSLYLDRPSSRRGSSYSYSRPGRGGSLRRVGYAAIAVVVLLIAGAVAQWLRPLPTPHATSTFSSTVTAAGQPVHVAWPSEGQAALAVAGVGTIGSVGGSTPIPIASVAKVMTAYQVLTDHPLSAGSQGPSLTVSAAAVADYRARSAARQSVLPVRAGEQLTEYQALQALLIPSANNVAALLAEWDAGNVSAFVDRMNRAARSLGLANTRYADPDGSSSSTVSTAEDQLTLAQAAMKLPVFAEIVSQPSATFPVTGKVFNYNYALGHDGFVGIKTGSDSAAGGCWAFAARRVIAGKDTTVFGVVLGQHAKNGELIQPALDLGKRLADTVPGMLRQATLVAAGTTVGLLRPGWAASARLVTREPVTSLAAPGQRYAAQLSLDPPAADRLVAGTVVGKLTVGDQSTAVVLARDVPGPTVAWRLTRR